MILAHATVITVDDRRRIITDGAIAIRGCIIADIGKSEEVIARNPDLPVRDCTGRALLPGLVDTHVHLAQAMIRGCADDHSLLEWLVERVWVLQGNYTEDDGRASAALCILEMLRSGTTTFLECLLAARYGFDGVAEVVEDSGIRARLAGVVMDSTGYAAQTSMMHGGMIEEGDASFAGVLRACDRWNGAAGGRIGVWFGPRTPGGCSEELFRRVGVAARERSTGITLHLAEIADDVAFIYQEYGATPAEFAERCGILSPLTVLAHGVWLPPIDHIRLARSGTTVAHCPNSNAKLASGIAPIPEMLHSGVNVALGCDGGPSNNTYDLLREMRTAATIHKARSLDPRCLSAETVLEMATINGARALGLASEIGSLEVGKRADVVVLDLRAPHLTPAPNPVSAIVYGASGSDVETVFIDGRLVVNAGKVVTMNATRIVEEAYDRSRRLYERAGIEPDIAWPML